MPLRDGYMIIVDDDEDDILFLQSILAESGINTTVSFLSGKDILHFILTTKSIPALILLDYNMPVLNGLEVLQAIRANEEYKQVPVILFSTGMNAIHAEALKLAGATACFAKPFSVDEARVVVNEIIDQVKQSVTH